MSDIEALAESLRAVAQAYPEDLFGLVTPEEREAHSSLVTRASAAMGRFLGKHLIAAADALTQQSTEAAEALDAAEARVTALESVLLELDHLLGFETEWLACGCFPEPDRLNDVLAEARVALEGSHTQPNTDGGGDE